MRIVAAFHRDARWSMAPRRSARGRSSDREAVFIAVSTDDGATGLGEAAPLSGFSIDTVDDARRAADALAARAPFELGSPADAMTLADQLAVAPAARFAIETALLAAWAQQVGTSIASLLVAAPRTSLTSAVVVDDLSEIPAGARCLKIKLADGDVARARAIAAAAPGARIRIDANRAWPRAEVLRLLGELAALPIEYVEEPCRDAHELLEHALPCPIALDESLVDLDASQLARALGSPHLGALVLKPTILGGFARCLELAALARGHGVPAVVTHTLEGPVGTAACGELARAIGAEVPGGLAPHPALDRFAEATWSAR